MENVHKKIGLVKFDRIYSLSVKNLDWWLKRFNFGSLLTISDHYWQIRTITANFGQLLPISDHYWQFQTIIDNFGPLLKILDQYWQFWTIIDNFGPLLTILDHYWQFRTIIDNFRPLLTISDHYWQFWSIIDNFGPLLTILDIIDVNKNILLKWSKLEPSFSSSILLVANLIQVYSSDAKEGIGIK